MVLLKALPHHRSHTVMVSNNIVIAKKLIRLMISGVNPLRAYFEWTHIIILYRKYASTLSVWIAQKKMVAHTFQLQVMR